MTKMIYFLVFIYLVASCDSDNDYKYFNYESLESDTIVRLKYINEGTDSIQFELNVSKNMSDFNEISIRFSPSDSLIQNFVSKQFTPASMIDSMEVPANYCYYYDANQQLWDSFIFDTTAVVSFKTNGKTVHELFLKQEYYEASNHWIPAIKTCVAHTVKTKTNNLK